MRSLNAARLKARDARPENISGPEDLLTRTWAWIEAQGFDIEYATAAFLDGGAALLSPEEEMLYVNEVLRDDPVALLVVLAHERGHLEQHERVKRRSGPVDPVAGSAYAGDGAAATARYHRHSREEAEATAFATEYVCPSDEAFARWRTGEGVTDLAASYGVSPGVVRVQLAQTLFDLVVATDSAESTLPVADDEGRRKDDGAQKAAAEHVGLPALVRAGPGTGKTATLVRRLAFLLEVLGVAPEMILVLTFSNDAAEEIRARVADRFDADIARRLDVQTFHGFGWSMLRSYGDRVGLTDKARILDEAGAEELVRDLIGQPEYGPLFDLAEADLSVRRAAEAIARVKDRVGPDDLPIKPNHVAAALASWEPEDDEVDEYARADAFLELFRAYEAEKKHRQRVDFADLIALPEQILRKHPESVRDEVYRKKYPWVLVDEYQDVSRTVARLLQQLCGPNNPLWGVGDDHQAIYRFRGAAPENVLDFLADFPDGTVYDLGSNYRACPELVTEACRLAALLDDPGLEGEIDDARWVPESDETAFDERPIQIAEAGSEAAEVFGVVRQVRRWIEAGARPEDIAILGRRNVDVRDVTLALGEAGIQAAASALVTPDGPGGALATVVTVPDRPRPSLPRLAVDLGRGLDTSVVNQAVQHLLRNDETEEPAEAAHHLVARVRGAVSALEAVRYAEDGFGMMVVYLFEVGALRPILDESDDVRRALDLSEVVTSLTRAAGYRFTHADQSVAERRLGFGQHFRQAVAHTSPSHVPAPHPPGAVRAMTLHASKGLEFPLVALVGQVIPNIKQGPPLLPPALRTNSDEDAEQADAALFVGVTRAKRGLLVTYAPKKTPGSRRHQEREIPALLRRWPEASGITVEHWAELEDAALIVASVPAVWGKADINHLSSSALGATTCELSVYLGKGLGLEFPAGVRDLYPEYVGVIRRAIHRLDEESSINVEDLLNEVWTEVKHPHIPAYRAAALGALQAFASSLGPEHDGDPLPLDVTLTESGPPIRLGLVRRVRRSDGTEVAVALHTRGPLLPKLKTERLSWTALGSTAKTVFAVLYGTLTESGVIVPEEHLDLSLFSVSESTMIPAKFKRGGVPNEAEAAVNRARLISLGPYTPAANARDCPACVQRTVCPFWLGLGTETG